MTKYVVLHKNLQSQDGCMYVNQAFEKGACKTTQIGHLCQYSIYVMRMGMQFLSYCIVRNKQYTEIHCFYSKQMMCRVCSLSPATYDTFLRSIKNLMFM